MYKCTLISMLILSSHQIVDEEIYDLLTDMDESAELKRNWFAYDNSDGLAKITLHDNGSSILLKNVVELEANTEDKLIEIFWYASTNLFKDF